MLKGLFLGIYGGLAYYMAQGASDWDQAVILAALPISAGLATVYLVRA